MTPAPHWQLELLGGLRLRNADAEHTRFATRAVAALLARLALWPQRDHPREELVELLWPGVDVATGRRRLRQALSLLRDVLEPPQGQPLPVIQADRLSLRVLPGRIACDVHRFEALARAGEHAAALACWHGELMPGFFDEWIHEERMRLNALHGQLVAAAPSAARPAPLPTAAALPPSLSPSPPSPAPIATPLPGYLTRYFAQPDQTQHLLDQVMQHRLVTVLGPGGSGKTRLAVELVEQLIDHRAARPARPLPAAAPAFARVHFVPLASAHSAEQLLVALQATLRISATPATTEHLVARLDGVPTLLVLDNAEQLAGAAADVLGPLMAALPGLHLLVTSRCPVGLDGEHQFPIDPLPTPPSSASLAEAAASPAVALFVDRARSVRMDFQIHARNHAAIVALVRVLQGMPLAIELAASRIRVFTPAEMVSRLRVPVPAPGHTPGLDLLARPGGRPTPQSRHVSMRLTIEWSWQQLPPEHQQLAAAMAVFPGGCTTAMLAAVHGGGDVAAGVEQLHAQSLVQAQRSNALPAGEGGSEEGDGDAPPRFQLYEPIREFAIAQFDAAHSRRWRARQRAWALAWLRNQPATPALARVRAELVNLCTALASAAADDAGDDAAQLLLALQPLHEGVTVPAETLAQAGQALAHCADAELRSRGHSALAPLLFTAGLTVEARQAADTALSTAPPDGPVRAEAWLALAAVHFRGALSPARHVLPWVEQAWQVAQHTTDRALQAATLNLLALVDHAVHRDADAAHERAARAQSLWAALGNRHGVNHARHNAAVFDFRRGRREQALATWDAILAEAAVLQDSRRQAIASSARCSALSDMHRWPQALPALRDSLRQSWQALRLYEVSYDLWNLPRVLAHLRQPAEAMTLMAFASQFWQTRFGELTPADRQHMRLVERLVARQLDGRAMATAAAHGRQLPLAAAVALALGD